MVAFHCRTLLNPVKRAGSGRSLLARDTQTGTFKADVQVSLEMSVFLKCRKVAQFPHQESKNLVVCWQIGECCGSAKYVAAGQLEIWPFMRVAAILGTSTTGSRDSQYVCSRKASSPIMHITAFNRRFVPIMVAGTGPHAVACGYRLAHLPRPIARILHVNRLQKGTCYNADGVY